MEDEEAAARELIAQAVRQRADRPTPKVSILLVDDVAPNLTALRAILDDPNYDLVEASSGAEALKRVLSQDFALILMDVHMPGMDGFECARLIKTRERSRNIPIIFVTATNKDDAYVFQGYEAGAIDYLFKPLDTAILRSKVAVFVELHLAQERLRLQTLLLEQANEYLREADRHKDEFLAVISHELRTPLNFITAYGSAIADGVMGPLTDEQRQGMAGILAGADRMQHLVDDLLDLSTFQAGKFTLDRHCTPIEPLVAKVAAGKLAAAQAKGQTLAFDAQQDLVVDADEPRLQQALANLVDNAVKFTPEGGQVAVHAYRRDGRAVFEVRDTGPGIAPEDQLKVFKRFTQLDMSATREASGAGLGLAICKAIVEGHGGEIGVEGVDGGGSRFWFVIPLAAPEGTSA